MDLETLPRDRITTDSLLPYPSPLLLLLLPSFLRPDPSTKADEREQRVDDENREERIISNFVTKREGF